MISYIICNLFSEMKRNQNEMLLYICPKQKRGSNGVHRDVCQKVRDGSLWRIYACIGKLIAADPCDISSPTSSIYLVKRCSCFFFLLDSKYMLILLEYYNRPAIESTDECLDSWPE
jgi:hypothetical protein